MVCSFLALLLTISHKLLVAAGLGVLRSGQKRNFLVKIVVARHFPNKLMCWLV